MRSSAGTRLASLAGSPGFHSQYHINRSVVVHAYDLSLWDMEARGSEVQGHLGYTEPAWEIGA